MPEQTDEFIMGFIEYLQGTLIPDLKESGNEATAQDFVDACENMAHLIAQRNTARMDRDRYQKQRDHHRKICLDAKHALSRMNERIEAYMPERRDVPKDHVKTWIDHLSAILTRQAGGDKL